jgi:hypothetical protein
MLLDALLMRLLFFLSIYNEPATVIFTISSTLAPSEKYELVFPFP